MPSTCLVSLFFVPSRAPRLHNVNMCSTEGLSSQSPIVYHDKSTKNHINSSKVNKLSSQTTFFTRRNTTDIQLQSYDMRAHLNIRSEVASLDESAFDHANGSAHRFIKRFQASADRVRNALPTKDVMHVSTKLSKLFCKLSIGIRTTLYISRPLHIPVPRPRNKMPQCIELGSAACEACVTLSQ